MSEREVMTDGDFVNVRVGTPTGGVLYFLNQGNDTGNGCAIYKSTGDALQFRGGPTGLVFNTVDNTTRVTISNGGQTTMKSADSTPLVLDAGDAAHPFGANIQFRKNNGDATWKLGASVANGDVHDFGLFDQQAGGGIRLNVEGATGHVAIGGGQAVHRLTVDTASVTTTTSTGCFYARNRTHGIGIGYQDVRQIVAGQPLKLNAGTTGQVYLGDVSTGGVSLAMAGGNVGIGVDNRTEKLAVRGPNDAPITNIGLFLANGSGAGVGIGFNEVRQIQPNNPLHLNAGTGGAVNIGSIGNGSVTLGIGGGSVGIGTTTPTARLHVAGTTRAVSPDDLPTTTIGAFVSNGGSVGVAIGQQEVRQINAGQPLQLNAGTVGPIHIGNVSTGPVTLGIGGGRIGIGVAGRPERLAVLGLDADAGTNVGVFFANNFSEGVGIGQQDVRQILPGHPLNLNAGTTGPIKIGNASSGHVTLAEGGGNVGIGTATPGARLTVHSSSPDPNTNIASFAYSGQTVGVGIGFQSVRQTVSGQPLELNAAGGGKVHIGNVSTGGVTLAIGGGSVGVGRLPTGPGLEVQAGIRSYGSIVADHASISTDGGGDIVTSGQFRAGSTAIASSAGCLYA